MLSGHGGTGPGGNLQNNDVTDMHLGVIKSVAIHKFFKQLLNVLMLNCIRLALHSL